MPPTPSSSATPMVPRLAAWPDLAGFRFFAAHCGIKASAPDLAWVIAETPAAAAAVFTRNRVQAAPVRLDQEHLARSRRRARALVVNSGNANCATGAAGERAARATAGAAAAALGCPAEQVLVCSTGVIGVPLPVGKITAQLEAWRARAADAADPGDGAVAAAQAILTTDTRAKLAAATFHAGGVSAHVAGFAKGAGMIHPRLGRAGGRAPRHATMLAFLFTDAALAPAALARALDAAVAESFHRITVDGDTSTNDTVLLLASGAAARRAGDGRVPRARAAAPGGAAPPAFQRALNEVAASLARQIVADGEGARRFVTIRVQGARDAADADRAARAIAHSPLVKTALAGADPNWGRILAAAGYSGARFDPARAEVAVNGLSLYYRGAAVEFDEAAAKRRLDVPEVEVVVNLRAGRASAWMWTCDLTEEYIRINASYRS